MGTCTTGMHESTVGRCNTVILGKPVDWEKQEEEKRREGREKGGREKGERGGKVQSDVST